jgi:NDP-sugar pyrophosphorylase family protein
MLLAAGRGERMEPLSSYCPKPALEVLGRPLLASAWDHLAGAGCERVVVNLHRHATRIAAAAREVAAGDARLCFSWEPELLGSAGGIAAARPLLGAGPVLVANADVWAQLDLAPLLAAGGDDLAVLALLPHPDPERWSSVVLGEAGEVAAFRPPGTPGEGPRYLFTGFQVLGGAVVAELPDPPAAIAPVWERLRERGALRGVLVDGDWREAGTAAAYHRLVLELLGGETWVHPQGAVNSGAVLHRSAVGAGCRVCGGAELEDTVVTAGAMIGEGCVLRRCLLAGPLHLRGAGELAERLVLPNGSFPLASGAATPEA